MPARINPESGRGYRFIDYTGMRNGRLLFTQHIGVNKHKHQVWKAQCDCGNITTLSTPKKTLSCGCLQREAAGKAQKLKALSPERKQASRKASARLQREKRRHNPIAVMHARLSRLHRHALRQLGAIKTSPTFEQLGYSVEEFVFHIERQFKKGMGWHNMKEWQIDHILPVSEAKDIRDVVALNQLTNLRPMWAKENNVKKNKRVTLL